MVFVAVVLGFFIKGDLQSFCKARFLDELDVRIAFQEGKPVGSR